MKLIFFLISIFLFSGCSKNDYINENISEIRNFLYEGVADNVVATLVCGYREKDYILDGYSTDLIEFGVLTFDIKDGIYKTAKFSVFYNENVIEGELVQNPFDNTLVVDLKKIIDVSEITVSIELEDNKREIKLKRLDTNWKVSSEEVKNIITKNFKEEINNLIVEGDFKGEVYIKILNDADIYKGDYYWYVSIIGQKGGKLNAIISPHTGSVLSSNQTIDKFLN